MASTASVVRGFVEFAWPFAVLVGVIVTVISFLQDNWPVVAAGLGLIVLGILGRRFMQDG